MPVNHLDDAIRALQKTRTDLIAACEMAQELQAACKGLLGLLSAISRRDDLPQALRDAITNAEAVQNAKELVG